MLLFSINICICNIKSFRKILPPLPVLALPVEDELDGRRVQLGLRAAGLFAAHVHYPGAPSAGVVRLAVNAEHGAADLRRLEETLAAIYPAEQDA